jgi:hypothetical protein
MLGYVEFSEFSRKFMAEKVEYVEYIHLSPWAL